jgi:esterase/lipase
MSKPVKIILSIIVILIVAYFIGPKPPSPELNRDLPSLPATYRNLDTYIYEKESALSIRPDNESRIVWAEGITSGRTDYSLLYLHGFSASWYEGYPANVEFARHFGMNAYLPRLAAHGLDTEDPLLDMTPDNLWESAKEALMVARTLGKKVIIMGTSTGGTLALKLAADFPEYIDGLILYSPNIRINNSTAFLLSKPWGLQLARRVYKDKYRITNEDFVSKDCQYWNCRYRLEAIVYLQQLVDATMKEETFSQVTAPVFLGYYYKDDKNQDQVVRVDAMLKMFDQLGTSPNQKVKIPFPEAGNHVIASELTSGAVNEVIKETLKFGEDFLNIKKRQLSIN